MSSRKAGCLFVYEKGVLLNPGKEELFSNTFLTGGGKLTSAGFLKLSYKGNE